MADKLTSEFGTKVHKLKIGKSFEKKNGGSLFHTVRYDFKPVSVDEERRGVLEVKENNSVGISLPHVDGSGQTNYKGNIKSANTKDCVLIIDHETGELTLERLSNQILVKKTRPERMEKALPPGAAAVVGGQKGGDPADPPSKFNPYMVKEVPDKPHNPYEVAPTTKPHNPYEVGATIKGPPREKPKISSQSTLQSKKSPLHLGTHKESLDSDFSISPMNSAKSSPVRPGSNKPSPAGSSQVDSLGRPLQSSDSSSASDSSSDSESDSEPEGKAAGDHNGAVGGVSVSMPTFLSQDFGNSGTAGAAHQRGGVLPTARPEAHSKSKKVTGLEDNRYKVANFPPSKQSPIPGSRVPPPPSSIAKQLQQQQSPVIPRPRIPSNSMANLLTDDLNLSDSD